MAGLGRRISEEVAPLETEIAAIRDELTPLRSELLAVARRKPTFPSSRAQSVRGVPHLLDGTRPSSGTNRQSVVEALCPFQIGQGNRDECSRI